MNYGGCHPKYVGFHGLTDLFMHRHQTVRRRRVTWIENHD